MQYTSGIASRELLFLLSVIVFSRILKNFSDDGQFWMSIGSCLILLNFEGRRTNTCWNWPSTGSRYGIIEKAAKLPNLILKLKAKDIDVFFLNFDTKTFQCACKRMQKVRFFDQGLLSNLQKKAKFWEFDLDVEGYEHQRLLWRSTLKFLTLAVISLMHTVKFRKCYLEVEGQGHWQLARNISV